MVVVDHPAHASPLSPTLVVGFSFQTRGFLFAVIEFPQVSSGLLFLLALLSPAARSQL